MKACFSTLSLRTELLLGYLLTFLVPVVLGNLLIFTVVRQTIETNTEKELTNSTNIIMNMVKSAADASIKNHLRTAAEINRGIAQHYYDEFRAGRMSEATAKQKAADVMQSQIIGKTGYVYSVDSKGVLRVHPMLVGTDLSKQDFIRQQIRTKEGYLEYEWANPGEQKPRKKALYMSYFGPWDWIISASSYRDEFKDLFRVNDFRDDILAVSFGKTGYPYVMDSKGVLIVHPKLQGQNIYDSRDSSGWEFIKEIGNKKVGKIVYRWQNPGETEPREKLVIFNYIPEFDWIVASSSYVEEFNGPLVAITYASLLILGVVIILVIPITWYISSSINKPIMEIMRGFSLGAKGDYSTRIDNPGRDELGQLSAYYNDFMDKLSESSRNLHISEEKFRLLFENAVEGVFTINAAGNFLTVNPSMARMLGYDSREHIQREVAEIGPKTYVETSEQNRLLTEISRSGTVTGFETCYRRRDGTIIWVALNARAYTDADGAITSIDGFCSDVTEKKRAEEAQIQIKEQLEQRVAARTAELSSYIAQLEQRNIQESLLREMVELLQVCRSMHESYTIINDFVGRFFPGCSGALFLFDETKSRLDEVVSWGVPNGVEDELGREECWALRQGKPYGVCASDKSVCCEHVKLKDKFVYLCTPLTAQGEVLGLLYIQSSAAIESDCENWMNNMQGIASTFTNNLGLSLANLRLQDRLWEQSIRDPLTGLYNRRFMEEFAKQEIRRSKRHNMSLSLVMVDVDHFKEFNDTYGHDAGDMVLKEIASFFKKHNRESDVVCRYGGEEFAVLLPACSAEDAAVKANKLCQGVREVRIPYQDDYLAVTISAGVAAYPVHGANIGEMLKAADNALYEAKHRGRDRVMLAARC